uniref:Uncharacterized protein n=1 Tax=Opuntia streptacantha TaxID=393608 RepID=A0A7C9DZ21_OPUST
MSGPIPPASPPQKCTHLLSSPQMGYQTPVRSFSTLVQWRNPANLSPSLKRDLLRLFLRFILNSAGVLLSLNLSLHSPSRVFMAASKRILTRRSSTLLKGSIPAPSASLMAKNPRISG